MDQTFTATKDQINQIINHFTSFKVKPTTQYMVFRAKIGSNTLTIYTTNKVHIQGPNPDVVYLEIRQILGLPTQDVISVAPSVHQNQSIIGTDEVGTGDYFGGIVVTACFVPVDQLSFVQSLGVKDSKQLNDIDIVKIAPQLKKKLIHASILLNNVKYNKIMNLEGMNMNKLKAILHNMVIQKILKTPLRYDAIVVDGFTSQKNYINYLKDRNDVVSQAQLIEKAEDQYLSVAAASVIARYQFLLHMEDLSKQVGSTLPKGASTALEQFLYTFIKEGNEHWLPKIAKMNFKTTAKVKERIYKL